MRRGTHFAYSCIKYKNQLHSNQTSKINLGRLANASREHAAIRFLFLVFSHGHDASH